MNMNEAVSQKNKCGTENRVIIMKTPDDISSNCRYSASDVIQLLVQQHLYYCCLFAN